MNEAIDSQLEISPLEKRKLRQNKIRISEIHKIPISDLQGILDIPKIRAMELFALSEFQSLPSIGIRFAQDLIRMGYYSLKDLKKKDGAKLLDAHEAQIGVWTDPCVEDQFRLVVYLAKHPGEKKNWWEFTGERKAFREKNGYPSTRPKGAWYNSERHQPSARIVAAKEVTRKELIQRLKKSVAHMKQHYDKRISLKELADASSLSSYHFLRQFKSAYELTPFQYLANLRLKKATGLLKSTMQSVDQICSACGFESSSSFIRLFRSRFSVTPMRFREKNKGK